MTACCTNWVVQVYTSDMRGAGTSARVSIVLYGSNGVDTGPMVLENSVRTWRGGAVLAGVQHSSCLLLG
jgi:hypothetical protein